MTQDCQQVVEQAYLNVNVFLRTLVSIITTLAFMFSITEPLTFVAFVSVPAVVAISMKYSAIFRQISEEAQKSLADANAVANEGLGNMSTIRSFAAESFEQQRFGIAIGVYRKLMKKRAMFYLVYLTSTMMLPQVVTAVVLFYGGKLASEGQMEAAGAAVRVFELCERKPDCPLSGDLEPHQEQVGALQLRDLHFAYPARPDVKVLDGLSLDIPASQVVALVGPSGNGKSTVIGLVKRLYHASAGEILLDGVPIWQYSHTHFHRVVSIVGQEPVLFARSIKENILLGMSNPKRVAGEEISNVSIPITDNEIQDFARKANAHDFISQMSQGYDAEVGERGVQLSGGQKQRIAIARALARRPKVLLLDEATSALDAESESQVQRAIDGMIKEGCMTVVIIAHRLSTVKNSHKICVIKGGQVVEEGRHEDLLKRGGSYFQLVQCQLNAAEPSDKVDEAHDYLRLQSALRVYAERYGPIAEVGLHWNLDKTLVASVAQVRFTRPFFKGDGETSAASQVGELPNVHANSLRDVSIEHGPHVQMVCSWDAEDAQSVAETISKTIASIEALDRQGGEVH
ncbi:ABC-type oligopeptide transporter ABCB9 (ATP-binding cassette sub-family B member 9) (ATP-binding cassette transporter 9) (ABC transporter 9 protein) (hABCB9) (TAP-like protein) (TAPL) [Durusdinium trenchii]|uniref:ABC-type oligopeptide transporter ABCB9 (ATP-binding cassette sub-family B member 9) (ATP-binding cassette transporter 9) (ABC transporter 9 protein) (HABCB9) (TAP-like protein) (TAPL) n=1 Tax=Durusdinium trenchii TaxID=1381693 RepID=A0ABP0QCY2_9DINO